MLQRVAGGDLNAVAGFAGFASGVGSGTVLLTKGFSLKRTYSLTKSDGVMFPVVNLFLIMLFLAAPPLVYYSITGSGSMHAPVWASLAAGLIVGAMGQRSRLCFTGGIRDALMFKQFHMLYCFSVFFAVVFIGNLLTGRFNPGYTDQPFAHSDIMWNFLGLFLVGIASTLLGGCPLRQLVLAGSGNTDSAVTVLGFLTGAAFAHNFGLASSPEGPTFNGKASFIICLAVTIVIGFCNLNVKGLEREGSTI